MIRPLFAAVLLALVPSLAQAASCESMWVTRNLIFDRAGYCFGSALGAAVFDNTGCIGSNVALSSADQQRVAEIREVEREYGCALDTSRPRIDLPLLTLWLSLDDIPRPDLFESACLGWRGPVVPLVSGTSAMARRLGEVLPGDTISFGHWPVGDWSFVEIARGGRLAGLGWTRLTISDKTCDAFAG
jgi:hypothetical protein